MPPKTRSRGACKNCKTRHRKCDETRPSCLACQRRDVVCKGYEVKLQWGCGIASRGHLAGSFIPPLTLGKNSIANDNSANRVSSSDSGRNGPAESPDAAACTPQDSPWDFTSRESDRLVDKFLRESIHKLHNTSTGSWIKQLSIDLANESLACRSTCVTLQLFYEVGCVEKFYICFEACLHVFRAELANNASSLPRGSLAAGLLLCAISINQGIPWTNYLRCLAELCCAHEYTTQRTRISDEWTRLLCETIGAIDLPNFILGRQTPCFGIWSQIRRIEGTSECLSDSRVENTTGLPHNLLDIFARADDPKIEQELWHWSGAQGHVLQIHFWDAWRFSGILVARRNKKEDAMESPTTVCRLPSSEHLVFRLVALLDTLRVGLQQTENQHLLLVNGMSYPYMVARSEFGILRRNMEWIDILMKVRELCLSTDTSYDLNTADKLLNEAWERGDCIFDIHQAALSQGIELALF